ncbi:MAG TPA: bifunctional methylenetetrahydrofolate dehydrogenase/methenyltetrahydrofolate cyclohydrolase FolD [Polyangiales bacterium]|nr:bifunctional methylenetetrahydrofolate dehydrogenase/methenyltetrahydrofolate cyclohydrolase FolD [Polyangiales bacterium]
MTAQILDGKRIAEAVRSEVQVRAAAFEQRAGRKAGLEVVLVGDDPASHTYVASKERQSAESGLRGAVHRLPADVSQAALLAKVGELNADATVDGILVQLPLPRHLRADEVVNAIDPGKDVDGLHPYNAGLLISGGRGPRPCTPIGCMRMLEETGVSLAGKRAIVIGRSNLVGKPLAMLLLEQNCTVTMAHSKTRDIDQRIYDSDIVLAALGKPEFVRGEWIREGAIVIDVGINRIDTSESERAAGAKATRIVGDVQFATAKERASWITPVPGGVGLMTVAMLLRNTLDAAEHHLSR